MRITHTWTNETATIAVERLSKTIRMLHITDSHIALIDDRDSEYLDVCKELCQMLGTLRQDEDGNNIPTDVTFAELMAETTALDLDLVALTGDIIHFPSRASVEHVVESMAKVDVPVLYTAGNHDWQFPGLTGREVLREAWWPALKPLYHDQAACARYEIGGIQFLLVDDSTYQIDQAQLAFVKTHLANGMPTVLFTHIPLSIATLRDPTLERWHAPILIGDPDWDLKSRDQWGTGADRPSTLEFVRALGAAENLVAVFCGHVHFPHVDAVSPTAVQYVGGAGFSTASRLVEFRPFQTTDG